MALTKAKIASVRAQKEKQTTQSTQSTGGVTKQSTGTGATKSTLSPVQSAGGSAATELSRGGSLSQRKSGQTSTGTGTSAGTSGITQSRISALRNQRAQTTGESKKDRISALRAKKEQAATAAQALDEYKQAHNVSGDEELAAMSGGTGKTYTTGDNYLGTRDGVDVYSRVNDYKDQSTRNRQLYNTMKARSEAEETDLLRRAGNTLKNAAGGVVDTAKNILSVETKTDDATRLQNAIRRVDGSGGMYTDADLVKAGWTQSEIDKARLDMGLASGTLTDEELEQEGYSKAEIALAKQLADQYESLPAGEVAARRTLHSAAGLADEVGASGLLLAGAVPAAVADLVLPETKTDDGTRLKKAIERVDGSGGMYTDADLIKAGWSADAIATARQELAEEGSTGKADNPVYNAGAALHKRGEELTADAQAGESDTARFWHGAATSAGENLAIAAMNPAAVLPVLTLQTTGDSLAESGEAGESALKSVTRAALKGGVSWGIEQFPVEQMLDTMGASKTVGSLAQKVNEAIRSSDVLEALPESVRGLVQSMGEEALEEFSETYADTIVDFFVDGDEESAKKLLSVDTLAEALQSAAGGAAGGALIHLGASGMGRAAQRAYKEESEELRVESEEQEQSAEESAEAESGGKLGADFWEIWEQGDTAAQNVESAGESVERTQELRDETAVNDDPAQHTAEESARIEQYKDSVDTDLADYVDRVMAGEDAEPYTVTETTDRMRQAMTELTGLDKVGDVTLLDANAVRHIVNRHGGGDGSADGTMSKSADIARAGYVLQNFDNAYLAKDRADGYRDSRGKRAPIVIFEKEIDGSHVVVEAVCDTKRNQNYIISEFIASKGVDQAKIKKALQAPMDAVADLRETSETLAADTFMEEAVHTSSDLNIAEDGETVNEESTNRAESAQEMRETEDGERQLRRTYGMGEEVTQEARQDRARRRLESWSVSETAAEGISEAAPAGIDAERYAAAASTMYRLGQMEDVGSFDRALELAGTSSGIAQNVNYVLARQAGRSALEIAYTYGRGEAESGTPATRYGGAVTEKSYTGSGNVSYEGTLERSGSDAASEIIRLNAAGTGTDAILRNVLENDTDVKAYVDTTAAKIYFGDRAQDIFGTVLHEDYHWYNSLDQEGAARLQEHALTYLASVNGYETMDEMIRAKMADYAGQSLTYEEAAEELVADAWRGIFDTEESFTDWVEFQRGQAEKNGVQKSAIRKVMESVRDMLDGIIQKAKEILGVDPDNRAAKQAQKLAESEKEILRREYFEHAETAMENLRNKKAANEAAGAQKVRFALSGGESSIEQQLNDSLDELAEMDAVAEMDALNEQARTLKKQIETAEENAEKRVRFQRVEAAKGNRQQQASRMIADKAQALDTLAQMMGITKGVRISEDSLVGLAEKWARENGARGKINTQELAGETRALAEYLKADGADMEKAASLSETIAGEILDAATVRNTDLWDEYQQLHKLNYTVDKNGQAKAELVKAYGSWGAAVKEARAHGVTLRQEANYRDGNPAEQYESIVNDVSAVSGAASGEAALFRSAAKDAGVDGALSMESTEWLEVLMNVHDAIKPTVESAFADVAEFEDARQVLAGQIIGDLMSVPEMTDAEAIFEQIQKRQREAAVRGAGSEEAAAETLKNLKKEQRAETRELKKTQRQIETDAAREEAQFGAAQAGIANLDANLELMGVDLATVGDVNEKLTVLREKYEQAWKEEKKRLREERRQMMDEIKLERRQAQADLYEMEQALKDETARANKAERSLLIQENEYAEWEAENERREEAWKQKQAERNVKAVELATRQAQEDAIRAKELADRRVQKARDGRRADELKRGIRNDAAALNQMLLRPSKGKYVNQTMITQAAEVAKMADAVTVNEKAILKLNTLQESIRREMGAESGTSIDWQNSGLDTLITTFRESVNAGKEAELARLQTQLAEAQALGESDETRALVERLEERIRRAEASRYGRSLTVEQLWMLKAITSGTLHTIRTANKTVSLAQNLEVDAMAEKAAAEVKSSEGNSVARLDPEKAGSKLEAAKGAVKDTVLSFKLWTMSPQRMLNMIGGYTSGGTMQKLGDALNEGQHKQHEVIMKGEAMFAEVLSEATADKRARFAGEGADLVDIGLTDTKGQKVKLNHAQLCSLWMHLKNEDSINHLAGQGFTVPNMTLYNQGKFEQARQKGSTVLLTELNETLDPMNTAVTKLAKRVEAAMDDYDRAWCRKMQDFFNHYTTDLINGTSLQLLGYKMANVKNYYPISVDSSVLVKEINGETADATIEGRGFTKQRQKSTKPILLEECQNVVQRSLRDTADYVGLAAPIRDVNKVLNTPVDEYGGLLKNKVIREQWGSETVKTIDKLIRDLQSKSGAEQNPITKTWRKLRSNYAGAVLTSNTGVILSQVSGAIANAAVLDGEATMKTMGQFAKNFVPSEYRKLRAEMREHGDWEMDYRMRGNEGDTLEDVGGRKDSLIQKGVDLIPDALTFMDEISVSAAWTGAKSYVKRHAGEFEGNAGDVGSEAYWAAVNQKYREAMEKTQPNNGMMQIAARQRSNDLLVTTMNMFKGQNYQNQGLLLDAFGDWNAQRKRYAAEQNETTKAELNRATEKMMRATVSQLASAALFAASRVVRDLILRKEERLQDENGDLTMESAVKAYGGYYLESVVGCALFGETAYSVIEQIVSSSTDSLLELTGAGSVDDIVEGFGDLYKLMRKNTDDMDAEELKAYHTKVFGALGDMGTAVGQAWGIPIQNLKNIGKAAEKWIEKGLDFDSLPESATGQYDRLYEAILDEDSETAAAALEKLEGLGKDDKTIFSQLKQRLDMSNADVQEAVQAQLSGDDKTRVETTKELIRKIYGTMGIDTKAKEDAEKREAVIDTVTGAINREVDNQLKGDGDNVYWEVLEAFENRDAKTMQDEMEKLLTAGKSETSVKSAITAAVKDEYVAGSERDRERIAKVLLSLEKSDGTALYEQKALDKWVTDAEKKEEEGEEDEWSELR